MHQYNLTVKTVWGDDTKDNVDLVDIQDFTTRLALDGLLFCIRTVRTRGPMRDRHLELVLGFVELAGLEKAQKILAKLERLPKYSKEKAKKAKSSE